jgi:hypothetical protein
MWQDGRDAGAGLCTRTRTRTGRTELSLTRALLRFATAPATSPRSPRSAAPRPLLKPIVDRAAPWLVIESRRSFFHADER